MSGIANIIDMINKKTLEKEKEIIDEAMRHKRLKLEEAERRASEAAERILDKAQTEVKAELSKYEAGAKLKSKYQLLEAKDKMIKEALAQAGESLEKVVGKAEYKKILNRLAVDGAVALGGDNLELLLVKGHEDHLDLQAVEKEIAKQTGSKTKVSVSKEKARATGGVLVRASDGSKWVDNTFEARLERMNDRVRDTIASILFREDKE